MARLLLFIQYGSFLREFLIHYERTEKVVS